MFAQHWLHVLAMDESNKVFHVSVFYIDYFCQMNKIVNACWFARGISLMIFTEIIQLANFIKK